jgi:hypothetical protein
LNIFLVSGRKVFSSDTLRWSKALTTLWRGTFLDTLEDFSIVENWMC